ncbi:MAG: tRNA-queuosine alpha-mannosyltransferase domain-containing protein [Planctomycetota bacterium]|jgi:glycosyltransferase involved in cell wall biosynthesis
MRILALEPYYGGSHKAFVDGWSAVSRHDWTVLELAAYKWKWRMRHSAITFADQIAQCVAEGQEWDLIFCSDMLNLAEFLGIALQAVQKLPALVYFHENQLTYPVRFESERDYQFAMTNMTTALAAKSVWFNSAFHRDSFLDALEAFLRKMPDCQPIDAVERIRDKALIYPPGVNEIGKRGDRKAGPLRILWAARWEHDKNPDDFFEALKVLKTRGINFRVSVIGQQFREVPEVFGWAKRYFVKHIDRWGNQQRRAEYEKALKQADVFVSTADHEFFGISAVEACLAGAYPVLPKRLAYPEILGLDEEEVVEKFFYDGSVTALADRLTMLSERIEKGCLLDEDTDRVVRLMDRYRWANLASVLDEAAEKVMLE